MSEFQVGDVVRLKSGGAAMTVRQRGIPGIIVCNWWSFADMKLITEDFPVECLVHYPGELPEPTIIPSGEMTP